MRPKPKEWTEAEKALIRLVRDGAPMREITAKLKRHAGSVRRMARSLNLRSRSRRIPNALTALALVQADRAALVRL